MTSDNRADEMNNPDPAAQTTASVDAGPTVGEYLRDAREQQGLSIEDVARELRMTLQRLKLLEADDFSYLNSDTFVRGYLRAYAKLLKVDPAIPMEIYQRQLSAAAEQADDDGEPTRAFDSSRPVWKPIAGIASVLVVVWIVSVWFLGNRSEPEAVPTPVSPVDYGLGEYVVPAEPVVDEQTVEEEPAPVFTGDVEVIERAPALTLDTLRFRFTDECWLEVVDSLGDVLHTNLQQAGSELTLQGKAPFQVKMGNAHAVSVSLNGEPLSLNIRPGTRLLNVTLGE